MGAGDREAGLGFQHLPRFSAGEDPGRLISAGRGGAEEETVHGKRGNGCEEGGPLALL